jgi:3-deoxy-D-manno-octulosonic-acid transferase
MKFILVPRHPVRFSEDGSLLVESGIPFAALSEFKTGVEKILFVDKMGLLSDLYQIANVAVVGGSFAEGLKGHNILEPVQAGVPVLFGPYMSDQPDLVETVLFFEAGIKCDLSEICSILVFLAEDSSSVSSLVQSGKRLLTHASNTSEKTRKALVSHLKL